MTMPHLSHLLNSNKWFTLPAYCQWHSTIHHAPCIWHLSFVLVLPIPWKLIVELFWMPLAILTLPFFQITLRTFLLIFKFWLSQVRSVVAAIPLALYFPNTLLIGMSLPLGWWSLSEEILDRMWNNLCPWPVSFPYLYQWHMSKKILFLLQELIEKLRFGQGWILTDLESTSNIQCFECF